MIINRVTNVALVWMLVSGVTAPAINAAEFLEFYKAGLAAEETKEWTRVAEMMQKAIALQPDAKARVKKSLFFRRYLPHFHLGRAFFESGDCDAALAAWQESESQGVVSRYSEFELLQEGRAACRQMADLQFALDEALQLVAVAEEAALAARRRLSELPGSDGTVASLSDRHAAAEASLSYARARLEASDSSLSEVEQAAAMAAETREEFDAIRREAKQRRVTMATQLQGQITARLGELEKKARQALASSEYLEPYPARVARRRAAVQQALEHAAAGDGDLSFTELQALESELEKTTRDLKRASMPPPAELRTAAEAYLVGDYAGVLAILAEVEFSSTKAASHVHLLNAAALFSLFHATGAIDGDLIARARQEILAYRATDPSQTPPASVFSPRFLAFFEDEAVDALPSEPDAADEGL